MAPRPFELFFLAVGLFSGVCGAENDASAFPWPSSARSTGDEPLIVVSTKNLAKADVVTVETLSGALARDAPRIYTIPGELDDVADAQTFWLHRLRDAHNVTLDTRFVHDIQGLLRAFLAPARLIRGYVRYSEATNSTNAALITCAALDADPTTGAVVVAAASDATVALLDSLGVPLVADATHQRAGDAFQQWTTQRASGNGNLSAAVSVFQPDDGSKSQCMAGYAVFARAPTVEYRDTQAVPAGTGGKDAEAVLARVAKQPGLGVSMGWGPEYQLVEHSAAAGAWVHASDWSADLAQLSNLPTHTGVRVGGAATRAAAAAAAATATANATVADAAVHTVAFLMSDGDNLCWLQGGWALDPKWWAAPERGQMPLGWTFSPSAQRLLPTVLTYAHETATANDVLVGGPSGAGYTYPSRLPASLQVPFANETAALMRSGGMRTLNIIDDFPTSDTLAPLLEQDGVDALFAYTYADYYAGLRGTVTWVGDKPVIGARIALWDNANSSQVGKTDALGVEALVDFLATLPKTTATANGYSLVTVNAWSHNVSDVARAVRLMEARGGFSVVTPDALAAQIVANVQHTDQCPTPTGSWRGACQASTCTMSGNGTCVLECQCKGVLGKMNTRRCNLLACSDLAVNAAGEFTCGGKVCPAD